MKKKDLIRLAIFLVVFAVIGSLIYSQVIVKGKTKTTTVEVVDPIQPGFDSQAISILSDTTKAVNFQPIIDLSGLGNSQPFGPLQ